MTVEKLPPLINLKIDDSSALYTDQKTINQALEIIYAERPDIFLRMAERDKKEAGIKDIAEELFQFLREHVKNKMDIKDTSTVLFELRRRVHLMFDISRPEDITT